MGKTLYGKKRIEIRQDSIESYCSDLFKGITANAYYCKNHFFVILPKFNLKCSSFLILKSQINLKTGIKNEVVSRKQPHRIKIGALKYMIANLIRGQFCVLFYQILMLVFYKSLKGNQFIN